MSKGKRSILPTRKKWKREINLRAQINRPLTSTAVDLKRKETMGAPAETDPSVAS
jgi:hypothetical protein